MVNEELPVYSARDLSPRYEALSEEDDEHGDPIFLYSSFGYITNEYHAYFGESSLRKCELNQNIVQKSFQRLPDKDVYPKAPSNVTVVSAPIDNNLFFKKTQHRLEKSAQHFKDEDCTRKITSAVDNLHSLGLAHDDLAPMNIMVDESDDPIIIDCGSCQPFGIIFITAGTPGTIVKLTRATQHPETN